MNPKSPVAVPTCPDSLNGEARKEWTRITRLLRTAGVISRLDRSTLALHCTAWARWVEAEGKLAADGTIIVLPNGYAAPNAWLAVANQAVRQMKGLAAELGLSPAARRRLREKRKARKKGDGSPFAPLKLKSESVDAQR